MKLMKLQKINTVLKKYSTLIMTSLLLLTKKDKLPNILFYAIISLVGYFMMNKDNQEISKLKDWKNFLGINKNNDNQKNKNLKTDDDDENITTNINKINEILNSKNNKDIDSESDNDDILFDEVLDKEEKVVNRRINKNSSEKEYSEYLGRMNVEYQNEDDCLFKLKVNENNKNTPIFNLRSSDKIDFYWNFHLHNASNSKINSLILCRDIHQWMSNSSISNEDLENRCYPLYIIIRDHKSENEIMIFEAYKIFVYTDENGIKQAFISKGDNFKTVEEVLGILNRLGYVKDLLNGKEYESYNLTAHHSVILFLTNLLSYFLPYESKNGEVISIDVKQYNENKNTFDYFYHTNIMDNDLFNSNI